MASRDRSKYYLEYSVDRLGYWITYKGLRVLHLPIDYKLSYINANSNTIVIATPSSLVIIIPLYLNIKEETI